MHHWLPITQFVACMVLIILLLISYSQTGFLLRRGFGVNQNDVIVVDLPLLRPEEHVKSLPDFVDKLNAMTSVKGVTISASVPSDVKQVIGDVTIRLNENSSSSGNVSSDGGVDENFIPFFGIKMLYGRNFLPGHPADSNSIILSPYAAVKLGFASPEKAVGEWILAEDGIPVQVIGIMEEYLTEPLTEFRGKKGSCLTLFNGAVRVYKNEVVPWVTPAKISLRVHEGSFEEAIAAIESAYTKYLFLPGLPLLSQV